MSLLVTNVGRLFMASDRGVVEDAAVLVDGDRVVWLGPAAEARSFSSRSSPSSAWPPDEVVDVDGALVTPGLIDAHTHPFYAGDRLAEIALRSAGAGYQEIAAQGGGIRATVQASRAAGIPALIALTQARLAHWLANGVTSVEAKTGYHLDRNGELAAVAALAGLAGGGCEAGASTDPTGGMGGAGGVGRAAASAGGVPSGYGGAAADPSNLTGPNAGQPSVGTTASPRSATGHMLPRVEVTFLGAHDASPELAGTDDRYAAQAAEAAAWTAAAADRGARFVDVFCDTGYFSVEQSRQVLRAGLDAGLLARVHADELARTGAARLAAELGATSADHLLCATEADAQALAKAGVTATLCPVTAMALGNMPPARLLLDHGVTLALGSDHNPGQSGTTSMSLVVGLTVHLLGLSVAEALVAATAGGASSLAAPDRGAIAPGRLADLVAWDAEHEAAFAWELGLAPIRVWKGGREVGGRSRSRPTRSQRTP